MKEKQKIEISLASWGKGLVVIAIAYALFLVHDFLLSIVASIIIASAIEPAALWARKKKISRLLTVIAVYVSVAILLAGAFYFLFLPLVGEVLDFIRTLPTGEVSTFTTGVLEGPSAQGVLSDISNSFSVEEIASYLNSLVNSLSQGVFSSASLIFGGALSFMLVIVLSFYLAVQDDGIGKFLKVIVPIRHEGYIVDLWRRSQTKIGLWMQGQLLLAVLVMVLVYLGLLMLGVPNALLLAVLAGLFEIIPLFGPILAAIPAIFVAFGHDGMSLALMTTGLFLIIQQFENHLLYPLVVKKVIGVPPMVSIVALVVGGQLAGFIGLVISVPIATVLMEFFSDLEKEKLAQAEAGGTSH